MDDLIGLDIMASSLLLTMGMKLFFFVVAALLIHAMLACMDTRSGGGFRKWRKAVVDKAESKGMAILGLYYCIRFAVLYIWAAQLFSS